ncbi:MAG: F0F1 ATP synthase subunit delta [Kiritimatiellia bacterium]
MPEILRLLIPIILAHAVVLAVIIIVVKRLLLSDTMTAVKRIRQVETEVRRKEEGIRREIEEHEKAFEKQKAEAEEELQKRREEGEKELASVKEQITSEANKEAEQIVQRARQQESKIREEIERNMEEKAVEYGAEVFKLVVSEEITPELNKHFINELLDALEEIDASNITADASQAEFRTSHPMDEEQKRRLEGLLKEKFGSDVKVEEQVDEELLAGLSLKMGSLEIDGTLLNRYKEAAAELRKNVE